MFTYEMRLSLRRAPSTPSLRTAVTRASFRRRPFNVARARRIVECNLSRLLECPTSATRTSAPSCGPPASAWRTTASCRPEDERQRRRAVTQIRAGDLARLDRLPCAVEDVVDRRRCRGSRRTPATIPRRRARRPLRTASPSSTRSARCRHQRLSGVAAAGAAWSHHARGDAASARICTARRLPAAASSEKARAKR